MSQPRLSSMTSPTSQSLRKASTTVGPLPDLHIGTRVQVLGKHGGAIKFIGETSFAAGQWVGIELDVPEGKNDGSVQGVQYFECKPLHGLFARPGAVTLEGTGQQADVAAEPVKAAPQASPKATPLQPQVAPAAALATAPASLAPEPKVTEQKEPELKAPAVEPKAAAESKASVNAAVSSASPAAPKTAESTAPQIVPSPSAPAPKAAEPKAPEINVIPPAKKEAKPAVASWFDKKDDTDIQTPAEPTAGPDSKAKPEAKAIASDATTAATPKATAAKASASGPPPPKTSEASKPNLHLQATTTPTDKPKATMRRHSIDGDLKNNISVDTTLELMDSLDDCAAEVRNLQTAVSRLTTGLSSSKTAPDSAQTGKDDAVEAWLSAASERLSKRLEMKLKQSLEDRLGAVAAGSIAELRKVAETLRQRQANTN